MRADERPLAWCVIELASPTAASLVDELTRQWEPGACYLPGAPWVPVLTAALPPAAVSRILRSATTRVWRGNEGIDAGRVIESIEHGCLPIHVTKAARLPPRLSDAVRALVMTDDSGTIAPPDPDVLRSRLDLVAGAFATGALERELTTISDNR